MTPMVDPVARDLRAASKPMRNMTWSSCSALLRNPAVPYWRVSPAGLGCSAEYFFSASKSISREGSSRDARERSKSLKFVSQFALHLILKATDILNWGQDNTINSPETPWRDCGEDHYGSNPWRSLCFPSATLDNQSRARFHQITRQCSDLAEELWNSQLSTGRAPSKALAKSFPPQH